MSGYEYRVIVAPAEAKKVKGVKTIAERFAHGLAEVMNAEAREGWEYVGHERFQVEGKSGMLGKSKTSEETFLIFRREKDSKASMPLDKRLETMVEMKARNKPATAAAAAPAIPAETITPVPPPAREDTSNKVAEALAEFLGEDEGDAADVIDATPERGEPRLRSGDEAPAGKSGIFSPLSTRDPDTDEKNAPSFGPAARD